MSQDLGKTSLPPKIFWAGTLMILTESLFCLEKRHKISGVHANLLQCPKGTNELKVWETLHYGKRNHATKRKLS